MWPGAGASAGIQFSVSNAKTVQDLAGSALNSAVGAAAGPDLARTGASSTGIKATKVQLSPNPEDAKLMHLTSSIYLAFVALRYLSLY